MTIMKRFLSEEDGATLVEYVLLVAMIGVVGIVSMRYLGGTASNKLKGAGNNVASSN